MGSCPLAMFTVTSTTATSTSMDSHYHHHQPRHRPRNNNRHEPYGRNGCSQTQLQIEGTGNTGGRGGGGGRRGRRRRGRGRGGGGLAAQTPQQDASQHPDQSHTIGGTNLSSSATLIGLTPGGATHLNAWQHDDYQQSPFHELPLPEVQAMSLADQSRYYMDFSSHLAVLAVQGIGTRVEGPSRITPVDEGNMDGANGSERVEETAEWGREDSRVRAELGQKGR
ncbi:hypothetical protein EJ04DRAFT_519327 [Polyplosphaeria fusca]|uniref:Uncharacterized protein n=1 Tax=Polyplosphaeria fusca TaxID=682080 RepID=A0A9P4R5H2_9PLEO|nr:hypothetical protein EJ04DRAFT_519327 [Polyplosphaeria fusca]